MNISLSASALSRETGSAVPSRVSLLIFLLRLNLVLAYGVPPEFRGGVHLFVYNRHTPSGHAVAYRWRSLLRVRRHGASKPQGSSERVLPWQVTMNQLIFASRSHTHYWYKVGMLKGGIFGTDVWLENIRYKSTEYHGHEKEYTPHSDWSTCTVLYILEPKLMHLTC